MGRLTWRTGWVLVEGASCKGREEDGVVVVLVQENQDAKTTPFFSGRKMVLETHPKRSAMAATEPAEPARSV